MKTPEESTVTPEQTEKHVSYASTHPFFKWFRRIFIVFLMLPLLAFLGFWGAMQFVDFNQYKPEIEQEFFQKTGQHLKIEGEVDVSVIPFVLTVKQIAIKNPAGFSTTQDLANVQAIEVELSLWDLFVHRQLLIRGLELEKPVINLVTSAQGQQNWHYFQQLAGFVEKPKMGLRQVVFQKVDKQTATTPTSKHDWKLRTLVSQNAQINWINDQTQEQYHLSDFDLMAFDVMPNKKMNLITEFDFTSNQNQTKFHVKLAQQLMLDDALKSWRFSDWQGNIVMVLPAKFKVPEVRIETNGKLFAWNMATQDIALESAQLTSLESFLKVDLKAHLGEKSFSEGHISSDNIQLQKWLRHSGLRLPNFVDKTALSKVALNLDWAQNQDSLVINHLDMQIDNTHFTGKVMQQYQADGKLPAMHFDLAINDLDLDKYRAYVQDAKKAENDVLGQSTTNSPVEKNADKTQKTPASSTEKSAETFLPLALPVDTLRNLNAEGTLSLDKFKAWGIDFGQTSFTLLASEGKLSFAPMDAKLYQGQLQSKLMIDVTGKTPKYDWSGRFEQVALNPFLTDGWQYKHLSGLFDGYFSLTTEGVNDYLLKQNMSGTVEVKVSKGAFQGVDLNKLLAGQTSTQQDATQFKNISLEANIKNGVFRLKKFNLNSERFSSIGTGTLNLPTGMLKAKLFTTYQTPPANLSKLKGMEVPVELTGPVGKVQWKVNMGQLLNNPANQQKLLEGLGQLLGH